MENVGEDYYGENKRTYSRKSNSDIVKIPFDFTKEILEISKKDGIYNILNMPILGMRIIFEIFNKISYDQFSSKNKKQVKQLSLFEKDFQTDENGVVSVIFSIKDVEDHRRNSEVTKALIFLKNFKQKKIKGITAEGKIVSTHHGFINSYYFLETDSKINIMISNHWVKKIMLLDPNYNNHLFKSIKHFSNIKHFILYLKINTYNPEKIVEVNWKNFQKRAGYNYSEKEKFIEKVLKPLKEKMDIIGYKGFNYKTKKDNIYIKTYLTNKTIIEVKPNTVKTQTITRKIGYWKGQHNLSNELAVFLNKISKEKKFNYFILIEAYNTLKIIIRKRKTRLTDINTDKVFLEAMLFCIKKNYKNSPASVPLPNGYLKLDVLYDEYIKEKN